MSDVLIIDVKEDEEVTKEKNQAWLNILEFVLVQEVVNNEI